MKTIIISILSFSAGALLGLLAGGKPDGSVTAAETGKTTGGTKQQTVRTDFGGQAAPSMLQKVALNARTHAGEGSDFRYQVSSALRNPDLTRKIILFAKILDGLSPRNWQEVLAEFESQRKEGHENAETWALFVRRAGEVGGKDAVVHFLGSGGLDAARSALTGWAVSNPEAALMWLGKEASPETHRQIVGAAMRGLAEKEPDLAASLLENVPIDRRKNYTHGLVAAAATGAGLAGAEQMVSGIISRAATRGELTDGYVANLFSELTEAKLRAAHMSGSVDAVATWVQDQARQPYVHPAVIRETAEYLARSNPAKAINWLDAIHATPGRTDGNPQGYGVVLNEWARQDGAKVVSLWLTTQSNHRGYDHMVTQYTSILATKDPTEAARLAMTIKDQGMRQSAIQRITAASRTAKKGK